MRGKPSPKRNILADPKFNSIVIAKFINLVMERGKKSVAQRVVYDCFDIISEKTQHDPLEIFDRAVKNVSPVLEVKSRRVGGANYQIPIEVRGDRRLALGLRWIIEAAKNRSGKPMREKLAEEFMEASERRGDAMKKKEDVQRMAEANRAFAHFA